MQPKPYQRTSSTYYPYTPISQPRVSHSFETPKPFQNQQPNPSISVCFQSFRKELWEGGLIRSISLTQKQAINDKISQLQTKIINLMRTTEEKNQKVLPSIDHTSLLLQKQNQIMTLQRKINSLESYCKGQTSKTDWRGVERQLRQNINKLSSELVKKQNIIKTKNQFIIAEFSYYNNLKEQFLKVKDVFDRAGNKGDLGRMFDGVRLPQANDYTVEQLTKDNPTFRANPTLQSRVSSLIHTLTKSLPSSSISNSEQLQSHLTSFILQHFPSSTLSTQLQQLSKLSSQNQLLSTRFNAAASIWTSQIKDFKRQYPSARIDLDNGITKLLQDSKINVTTIGNVVQLQANPIVEIPMAESKTSQLLLTVCKELRRIISRYPKINGELSDTTVELLNEGVIDFMEVGNDPNKIIEIVRYLPHESKTDHVYSFNGDKNKRLQFHLRVLLKALLQQLDRIKNKTGQVLQLDESVIKMIQQQIMDVVSVDDILKVFKVNTKIVEVEKIIEKIVEKIVEVPQIIPIEKIVEKIIQVPKIQQIQKIIHVPVEIIKVVDNVIEKVVEIERIIEVVKEVPKIIEKIVERIVQVPKIVEVQKIVQKIVIETQIVEVQKIVNNIVYEIKQVQKIVQKIVPYQKIVQRTVQVPVYVEKIVQKVVQIPTIVQVQKIVQKVVRDTEVRVVKQNNLEIQVAIEVVDRIVQKIVVVDNYIEKLVQVPKIIEKIVQVKCIETVVKEVEVVREKIVKVYQIKEVERIVNVVVPLIKQVSKIVQRKVQIPFYQQRLVTVPQIITRIQIQRIQIPKIIEIQRIVQKPIIKNVIVQIQKPVIHYVTDYQIIKHNVEKIIMIPKVVQRIKEVKVHVDKLIEKLVEVPKVIEIEKIIEKVVVIPRIIEKVVEVPQIVEIMVERIVEVEKIIQIQREIEIPVIKEVIVQVQVVKNVYIEVEKIVDRVVQKIVPFETIVERIVEVATDVEKIIPLKKQIPKSVEVEKIVTNIVEIEKVVEIEKHITIPVEVPYEVEKIVEKIVVVENNFEKIVQVPQIIERIVEIHTQLVEIEEVERIVERIIPKNVIQTVTEDNVIVEKKVEQVPAIVEKLVPVKEIVREIVEVERIVEKIVERIVQVPKIIEIERIVEKIVKVPEYIQLEKIVPQLIKVNNIVQLIVQKIISVPLIQQVIKSIPTEIQKIVQLKQTSNKIHQIEVFRDKIIQIPKLITVDQTNNVIQKELQVIERFEQISIPVYSTIEKIIEVPQILEKIVEKIIMMPQVVEVIKNIHHISDSVGNPLPEEVAVREDEHRSITNDLKKNLDILASELRRLKPQQPHLKTTIQSIEKMFVGLEKSMSHNRVVSVPHEVIVEKQVTKPVVVNNPLSKKDNDISIALALLASKLVTQLARIKKEHQSVKLSLDQDITLTFFAQLSQYKITSLQFQKQLRSYTDIVLSKFRKLGGWKTDHEMMLLNTLQEKFTNTQILKTLNEEIKKVRQQLTTSYSALKPLKQAAAGIAEKYKRLEESLEKLLQNIKKDKINGVNELQRYFVDFSSYVKQNFQAIKSTPITRTLSTSDKQSESIEVTRLNSKLRESFSQLENLKSQFLSSGANNRNGLPPQTPKTYRSQDQLKKQIQRLQSQLSNGFSSSSERQLRIQFQAKLRDQASFYQRQLYEMKGTGYRDTVKEDSNTNSTTLRSPYHSTNTTNRLEFSRMESRMQGSSRIDSSNHRILTSPSSVNTYTSPDRYAGRSMYSSMIKKI